MVPNIEAIKASGNGGSSKDLIRGSGLYDVKIKYAYMKTKEGTQAKTLWLRVSIGSSDKQQVLFIKQTNNNGAENFEKILTDKLLVCCGIEEVKRLVPTKFVYKEKEYMEDCIKELEGKEVTLQIRQEFDKYNGKINESFKIVNIFRTRDKATAIEIVNNADLGKRYNTLEDNYVNSVAYRNTNKAECDAYIKARASGNAQQVTTTNSYDTANNEIPF